MPAHAAKQPCPQRQLGRPADVATRVGKWNTNCNKHIGLFHQNKCSLGCVHSL